MSFLVLSLSVPPCLSISVSVLSSVMSVVTSKPFVSAFFTFPLTLNSLPPCNRCHARFSSLPCQRCKVAYYCSNECLSIHSNHHKAYCDAINKTSKIYLDRIQILQQSDAINYCRDFRYRTKFLELQTTHSFIEAAIDRIQAYRACGTQASILEASKISRKLLFHCRSNIATGLQCDIVAMLCQLGMDQQAYDLIKWYESVRDEDEVDWTDPAMPYLSIWGADRSRPILFHFNTPLVLVAADVYIKFRLYLQAIDRDAFYTFLHASKKAQSASTKPLIKVLNTFELVSNIYSFLIGDSLSKVKTVQSEIIRDGLTSAIERAEMVNNPMIWNAVLDPAILLSQASSDMFEFGSASHVQRHLAAILDMYLQCPRIFDFLRQHASIQKSLVDTVRSDASQIQYVLI
jgi:hypothetical protein